MLLLTEWREFADLDPVKARELVAHPVVVDGRDALDAEIWRAAGWRYHALGRPFHPPGPRTASAGSSHGG
ncbi:hypothetical protein [Streptosporangium sp. NPDC006007]|uniref:hypothetical protein n=1 Tax=Streptosporangium sp. NPDC006007 TaxID=3154575 RepID=UPI0033BB1E7E